MTQFRTLPQFGGDERAVAEVVRGVMDGKTNNTGRITLATGNATTTTLYDERIGYDSLIFFVPASAAAMADAAPYGAFQDDSDQTAASANTAYPVTFTTTDYSNGVYLSNSSRINVRNGGIYNLQFSAQFTNTDTSIHDIDVWLRKNGSNVAGTNGQVSVPNKHGGINGHTLPAWNYIIDLAANDYVELVWNTTSTQAFMDYIGTQSSPTRPSTASIIATMQYIAPLASDNIYVSSQQQGQATVSHWANSTADKTYGYIIVG
jgi:hypothetical protein